MRKYTRKYTGTGTQQKERKLKCEYWQWIPQPLAVLQHFGATVELWPGAGQKWREVSLKPWSQ
jgi:hypothetical protein